MDINHFNTGTDYMTPAQLYWDPGLFKRGPTLPHRKAKMQLDPVLKSTSPSAPVIVPSHAPFPSVRPQEANLDARFDSPNSNSIKGTKRKHSIDGQQIEDQDADMTNAKGMVGSTTSRDHTHSPAESSEMPTVASTQESAQNSLDGTQPKEGDDMQPTRRSARAQAKTLSVSVSAPETQLPFAPSVLQPAASSSYTFSSYDPSSGPPYSSYAPANSTDNDAAMYPPPSPTSTAMSYSKKDKSHKPPFSYAALIGQAINSKPNHRISLNDIYYYICLHYPYYKKEDAGWQNSIRHNLSLNECFMKSPRTPSDQPGKGSLWCIVEGCEEQFANGGFVKRLGIKKAKSANGTSSPGKKATSKAADDDAGLSDVDDSRSIASSKPSQAPETPQQTRPAKRARKNVSPRKKATPKQTTPETDHDIDPTLMNLSPEDTDYKETVQPENRRPTRRSRRQSKASKPEPEPVIEEADEEEDGFSSASDEENGSEDDYKDEEKLSRRNGRNGRSRTNTFTGTLPAPLSASKHHFGMTSPRRTYVPSPRGHHRAPSFPELAGDMLPPSLGLSNNAANGTLGLSALSSAATVLGSPTSSRYANLPAAALLQSPEGADGPSSIFGPAHGSPYMNATQAMLNAVGHHTHSPVSSMRSAFGIHDRSPSYVPSERESLRSTSEDQHSLSHGRPRSESSPGGLQSPRQHYSPDDSSMLKARGGPRKSREGMEAASRALQMLQSGGHDVTDDLEHRSRGLNINGIDNVGMMGLGAEPENPFMHGTTPVSEAAT